MKKAVILICGAISACVVNAQAEYLTSFHCDFNNGIPEDIVLVDNDGNDPSPDVVSYGFEIGDPWVVVSTDDSHVRSAASTSWYKTPAESDDWMILPTVKVVSSDVNLTWEARAHDDVLSDGYNVYISESGRDIADFKGHAPAYSCMSEKSEWTKHTLSLADFIGKEINIAFVNNSKDKALLYIDNIAIAEKKALAVSRLLPAILTGGEKLVLDGTVSNNTDAPAKGVNIVLSIDGRKYFKNDPSLVIPAYGTAKVCLETDFVANTMASYPYTLTVASGEYSIAEEGILLSARQNVLVEEGTGTWCMWCPRGAVAIENLKAKYPETFIPVAVHNGDPMVVEGYSVYTNSGYPVCVANRIDRLRGDPKNMEDYYLDVAGKKPIVALIPTGEVEGYGKQVTLKTNIAFSKDYSDAKFALQYIVVENNVHSENPHYSQKNGYAGSGEIMGGFENLPNPVPAAQMWYQDVARKITGADSGIDGSIPAYIAAGEVLNHEYGFTLDDNIMNLSEIKIIAAIIDTQSGEIVNSAYVTLPGISSVKDSYVLDDIQIKRSDSVIRIVSDSKIESIALVSLDGTIVGQSNGKDSIEISEYGHGIFVLRVKANGKFHYFKQII